MLKDIDFRGSSLDDLRSFPSGAMRDAGYQLDRVQHGEDPSDFKPMRGIGSGVYEIRVWDDAGTYRVIYVAKFVDTVHVLHCFQKKTEKTSQKDIDLARSRFKELLQEIRP